MEAAPQPRLGLGITTASVYSTLHRLIPFCWLLLTGAAAAATPITTRPLAEVLILISGANDRLSTGMSLLHSTVYAARRRLVPILITSLTTIAGLFSLAAGLGGGSLVWGPVATAIVWGIAFSTVLTLLLIPLLYRLVMGRSRVLREATAQNA